MYAFKYRPGNGGIFRGKDFYETYLRACPGRFVNIAILDRTCVRCPENSINERTLSYSGDYRCFKCKPGVKRIISNRLTVRCVKCPDGQIAVDDLSYPFRMVCKEHNCSLQEYFNYEANECLPCTQIMQGSIGRANDSMPIKFECRCPTGLVKVYQENLEDDKDQLRCLDLEDKESAETSDLIVEKIKEALSSKTNGIGFYLVSFLRQNPDIYFKVCNSTEDRNFDEWVCLCELNHSYKLGKCHEEITIPNE
ncbi:MAG: hypothetical protein MHPSP_001068 [Paramarteilia canceri]